MNILLWVLQILAALLYGASGVMKTFMFDKISGDVPSFGALPKQAWIGLGILELVCTIGLILPAALGWHPRLTVLAAAILAIAEPAIDKAFAGGLGIAPVTGRDIRPADQDLAILEPCLAMQSGLAGRAFVGECVVPLLVDRDRACLGGAIDLRHRHAPRVEGPDQPDRHDRRPGTEHAQAGKIGRRPCRMPDQGGHDRRHDKRQRRAGRRDRRQSLARIESAHQHDFGAERKGGNRLDVQPADMEHRQEGQDAVVRRHVVHVLAVDGIPGQRILRKDGTLRPAGRPRRVDQQHRPVRRADALQWHRGERIEFVQPQRALPVRLAASARSPTTSFGRGIGEDLRMQRPALSGTSIAPSRAQANSSAR